MGRPKAGILLPSGRTMIEHVYDYSHFTKETGGKPRLIDNPTGILKHIQASINERILRQVQFPSFVIGGIKGRKPIEHPQRHVNKRVVVTLDVKECFPSVSNRRIFEVWYRDLGYSSEVSRLATKLTTTKGHLPLGAGRAEPCKLNLIW